jgi:hypothetical protein
LNRFIKYLYRLLFINVLVISAGYLLIKTVKTDLILENIILLSILFSVIGIITFSIFLRGQKRDPQSQTFHSLIAISLKFLLEIGLALIWFILAKKNSLQSLLIFFVIYLTLTLYSILAMLKILKNRSLQNRL